MKLSKASIRNFRRLEDVELEFEDTETLFVGPNNSGKTSATAIFRCFLSSKDFKIHDFSIQRLNEIDAYSPNEEDTELPTIILDLWFNFDPNTIAFGRAFALLSSVSSNSDEVGMRCCLEVDDLDKLWNEYNSVFSEQKDGNRKRNLSHYLGIDGNFKKHFSINYASLERTEDGKSDPKKLKPTDGKRILNSLLRADFVDAQRNMNDDEDASRSSKLSTAFASFYRNNLDQAGVEENAVQIIDENNQRLTDHYDENFKDLMFVLDGLGVPAAHERRLKVISAISADVALRGSTDLIYIDDETDQELPEAYNGLGFKNLVLMAIQIRDYQLQWLQTLEDRPSCHLIFIEEPEVHLHAQVQQTFISNMWNILNTLDKNDVGSPQLIVTTHSSHILNSIEFEKVKYFRRCKRPSEVNADSRLLPVSQIHNLRNFSASNLEIDGNIVSEVDALNFLKRYLSLSHCDLFFADAVILIEGTVERLLLPSMIKKSANDLNTKYLSILEVGGAFAHRFVELMAFLHIPYLVITDIDSVIKTEGSKRAKACCAVTDKAITSNASLKSLFPKKVSISDYNAITKKEQSPKGTDCFIAFQQPIEVEFSEQVLTLHGRTFEETFIFENLSICGDGNALSNIDIPDDLNELNVHVFELIRQSNFKKTEFALTILSSDDWNVPSYVAEGLSWLSKRLKLQSLKDHGE